ncbi:MAG: cupin domain-containing protein [Halobaculum sp.]
MKKVSIDDVTPEGPPDENVPAGAMAESVGDARQLAVALGVEGFSMNLFELAPGQSSAHSMHKHPVQEEVFVVLDGAVEVERPSGDSLRVGEREALRVPPDTYQFVVNRGDEPASVLALGAPREYQAESRYLIHCPDCGDRTEQTFDIERDDGTPSAILCECSECGGESHRISI